ncbi:putative laccase-9 isoform X2 [Euphorbia lathyris]
MVVNGSIPGPTIYVQKGDTMYVNVHNKGESKVTIHWHGVKQPRNPWSDGPEYITQCAIKPGTNFTYEVIFSDEEGTLWWHAHSDWTRNTVYGAIVIYPEEGTSYPFPMPHAEQVLVLGSWFTYDVNMVVAEDLATGANIDESDGYLINGLPGDLYPCSQESTTYRFEVEYGKTYLLRVVNGAMNSQLFLAVAQHNLTIVGMDGSYLKPFNSSYIIVYPGNTMDILLTADQAESESDNGLYYIAARQFYSGATDYLVFDNTTVTAIIEYQGNYSTCSSKTPAFPSDTLPDGLDYVSATEFRKKFRSLYDQEESVPTNITTKMYIAEAMNEFFYNGTNHTTTTSFSSSLNNITWVHPDTDVLQAYYNNISGFYTEDFPDMPPTLYDFVQEVLPLNTVTPIRGTKVKVLEYGEEVEMVFQTSNVLRGAVQHPMHLHGYAFYVVGVGDGDFDFEQDPKTYNLIDPPYVNTAAAPKYGWLAVRFKAVNPGVWLWHCHMDRHFSWGMATVLLVKDGPTADTSMRHPPSYMPPCDDAPQIQLWNSQYTSFI